jgi:hypothetical protein
LTRKTSLSAGKQKQIQKGTIMKQLCLTTVILGLCFCSFELSNQALGQTIINDDFDGTSIDTNVWITFEPFCDSQMYESNGVAVFVNNGSLLTTMALPAQYEVDGQFQLAGSSHDFFTLVLRTDSTLTSCEQFQGISFTVAFTVDQGTPGIQNLVLGDNIAGTEVRTNFALAMDTFYPFKMVDNATNVILYLGNTNTPTLMLNTTNRNGYQLGIQNRDGACGNATCPPSLISAGSIMELNYLTVIGTNFVVGIITIPTIAITGSINDIYSIQYVTNLSATNWITLASNIVLQGSSPYYYPDTNSIGEPYRFYRVVAE